jgi:hypothetical protein
MIKNVRKKGRVQHVPDSRLRTSLEWREPGEKIKYIELSANIVSTSTVDESHGSSNVYRCESGRCHSLPFFLTLLNVTDTSLSEIK